MKAHKLIPRLWVLISLLFTIHNTAQNNIVGYEYGFDNDDSPQYVAITPTQDFNLVADFDVSSLPNDVNVFHIRFLDDIGQWSSIISKIFVKPPEASETASTIVGYEYGFNDGDNIQYVPITASADFNLVTDFDVSSLSNDVNVFYIRFLDDIGQWSSMLSKIFVKPPEASATASTIVGYEYGFNDGDNIQYVPITATADFNLVTDIDVSSLPNDVNVFYVRFLDDIGQWSSMLSKIFVKPPEVSTMASTIVGYEYGFNDGDNIQYVPITATADFNLVTDIDVSSLPNDVNTFYIRFLDDIGQWSSFISKIFVKPPEVSTMASTIVGYEYGFYDDNPPIYVPITASADINLVTDIDVSSLPNDINTFYIRFLDDIGQWSSMISKIFIKPPETDVLTDNKLVSYEYWFDYDVANKRTIDIDPDAIDLIVAELDMTHIWRGERQLHTQYKDSYGKYSLVMTDTIIKTSLPIAAFEADQTAICVGESVSFTDNGSIDYDTYTWDFDDGDTSTDTNAVHQFTSAGSYDVSLTVVDTNTAIDSVLVQTITVVDYPLNTVSITGDIPACFGEVVTLTADDPDVNYIWSNGETTQSIEITDTGTYSVELYHNTGATCTILSDEVEVTFYPEIDTSISVQSYPLVLTANQTAATYQWIDCTNGDIPIDGANDASYEPTVNGEYAVAVTQNGCTQTSDCETITTIAVADYAIKQLVQLYPNPAQEVLHIRSEIPIILQVYNTSGILVKEIEMSTGEQAIDINNLSSGLYFSKVIVLSGEWKNQYSIYKIVKQ